MTNPILNSFELQLTGNRLHLLNWEKHKCLIYFILGKVKIVFLKLEFQGPARLYLVLKCIVFHQQWTLVNSKFYFYSDCLLKGRKEYNKICFVCSVFLLTSCNKCRFSEIHGQTLKSIRRALLDEAKNPCKPVFYLHQHPVSEILA